MKRNEARPVFRILAATIAIPSWIFLLYMLSQGLNGIDGQIILSFLFMAVSFSYVSIAGYMPKFLLQIFSRGPVGDDKDLK